MIKKAQNDLLNQNEEMTKVWNLKNFLENQPSKNVRLKICIGF